MYSLLTTAYNIIKSTARIAIIYSLFVILIFGVSINNSMADENVDDKVIATILPITGTNNRIGNILLNAVKMAWYEYAPSDTRLETYDSQTSNSGAKTAYVSAIKDGAKIIIGPLTGTNTKTIKSHSNSNVINLSLSNSAYSGNSNIYITSFTPQSQGLAILEILEHNDFERAVVFIPKSKFGEAIEEGLGTWKFGRIIETIYYPPNLQDFSDIVKNLVKEKEFLDYDAIILADGNTKVIRTLSSQLAYYDAQDPIEEGETTIPMIGGLGWQALNGAYKEPPLLDGYYIATPHTKRIKQFNHKYKQLYNITPPLLAGLAYDMTALAIIAINSEYMEDKLKQEESFSGVSGTFKMGDYGTVFRTYNVMKVGRTKSTFQYKVTTPSR